MSSAELGVTQYDTIPSVHGRVPRWATAVRNQHCVCRSSFGLSCTSVASRHGQATTSCHGYPWIESGRCSVVKSDNRSHANIQSYMICVNCLFGEEWTLRNDASVLMKLDSNNVRSLLNSVSITLHKINLFMSSHVEDTLNQAMR